MKRFFQKIGFHKMDEMEQYIIFKAQRNAYLFLIAALLLWSFYESYQVYAYHGSLNPVPGFLLVIAVCIQNFSQLALMRNAVKDDADSFEREPFIRIILLIFEVAGVIAVITAAIILMGVNI